jgi:hypothetical protein
MQIREMHELRMRIIGTGAKKWKKNLQLFKGLKIE